MSTVLSINAWSAVETPAAAATRKLLAIVQATYRWISDWSLDERTRFLSQADDHTDLERRMRHWDQLEQHSFQYLLP